VAPVESSAEAPKAFAAGVEDPDHTAGKGDFAMRKTVFAIAAALAACAAAPASASSDTLAFLQMKELQKVSQPSQAVPAIPRQIVTFQTAEPAGTIIVDTSERRLYLVLGGGKAMRYGVGVGRPGFEWQGEHRISQMREWPDWRPPTAMLQRRPDLPRHMAGGPENPLGARAMYLGSSIYRIHGSNEPESIGSAVSSGCIRMTNEDVEDLYTRVRLGTKVIVMR
jgi:lipoprotein-anchoring transpeptidase ErfK/SrfK